MIYSPYILGPRSYSRPDDNINYSFSSRQIQAQYSNQTSGSNGVILDPNPRF